MKFGSTSRLLGACVGGMLLGAPIARADLQLELEAGAGYSDNITRSETDKVSEKIGTIGVDLLWLEQTRRIDADTTINLSYFEYLDNTFDSEVVGNADGMLRLGILPERFTWLFQDTFGQAQSDPFSPITPENRENVNYFTTGPDIIMRVGQASSLRLFGRYSATTYEESPFDAERQSAGLAIARRPSERSEIALNAVADKVDFDDPGTGDFDRNSAFVSYGLDGSRTDIDLNLGYTWLKPDSGQDTGGPLAVLEVARRLTESSAVYLELANQFTDAGEALRAGAGGVGGTDITSSGDLFENRSVSLRWNFTRNRTGFELGAGWNEDQYEQQTDLDRTRFVYEARFTRRLRPSLDLQLSALLNSEDFDNRDLESDEFSAVARLNWQAGRRFGLSLTLDRSDRSTSDGFDEYTENRVFLAVTYRPVTTSRTQAER